MRLGTLLGDLDNGYVSVGKGVSLITKLNQSKKLLMNLW